MSLSDLLRSGLIEKYLSDEEQIRNEVEIARNDLSSAKKMLGIEEWGWVHNAAYNAMLQVGRALMFSKGLPAEGTGAAHRGGLLCQGGLRSQVRSRGSLGI